MVQGVLWLYQRVSAFVLRDIWLVDLSPATGRRRWLLPVRVIVMTCHGFFHSHQCLLRAAALTYTTMLALVPMLAFMFAFLKGLGVQNQLEPILIDKLPVDSEQTVRMIISYVNKIEVRTLGAIGLGALFFTTLLQLNAVEKAFNAIWGVSSGRSLLRQIADYVSVMVIAPVVLLLVTAMNTAIQNQTLVATMLERRLVGDAMVLLFTTFPYAALWLVFAFFYVFLPNTRVQVVPALIGGVIGGTLWQVAQWAYIDFQIGVTKYQAIYGALAQLPVFMVWIYMSWVVTLLGAELSRACQHGTLMSMAHIPRYANSYVREWLASELYFSLVQRFRSGAGPWSAATFARRHQVPTALVQEVLVPLREKQFLIEMASQPDHYVPGRDPATLTPWEILHALRHHGDGRVEDVITQHNTLATRLLTRLEASMQEVAGTQSVVQWLSAVENQTDNSILDERTKPCD